MAPSASAPSAAAVVCAGATASAQRPLLVLATTMAGTTFEVEVHRDSSLRDLRLRFNRITGWQPWQQRFILHDGTALHEDHRLVVDCPRREDSPLRLTLITTRGIPAHVHEASDQLFVLIGELDVTSALVLLREGAVNVNARTEVNRVSKGRKRGGTSLLLSAADNLVGPDLLSVARTLLEMGAKPNIADAEGRLPIHSACLAGQGRFAELLLEHRADHTVMNSGKQTPLHMAMELFASGSDEMSLEKVALGRACCAMVGPATDLNAADGNRNSPISLARESLFRATSLLLEQRKRLSQQRPVTKDELAGLSSVPKNVLDALGKTLWAGWPSDFLPERNEFVEKCFAA